jgi:hypothetical protein
MQEMGFPLFDEGREGRRKLWKLDENYVTRLPNINLPELKLDRQEVLFLDILLTSGSTLGNSGWDRVRRSTGFSGSVRRQRFWSRNPW